jgi:hypothetical protein
LFSEKDAVQKLCLVPLLFNIYSLLSVQVPVPIPDSRSRFMAMKWLILAAKDKDPKMHFPEKLAWELVDAAANQVCSYCLACCRDIYHTRKLFSVQVCWICENGDKRMKLLTSESKMQMKISTSVLRASKRWSSYGDNS